MDIWNLPSRHHRNLWWLLTAPTIIEGSPLTSINHLERQSVLEEVWQWMLRDIEEPNNIHAWFDNPHRQKKLGLYAEDLLHYYLQWGSEWRVCWHDVQIQEHKRSIGAIDFIVEKDGITEHWEMTVKFYLQRSPSGKWSDFIGADERDSLHKKWAHFFNRQLPLSSHTATIAKMNSDNIIPPTHSKIWHCGLIFGEWNQPFVPPEKTLFGHSSDAQPQGFWIRRKHFIQEFFNSSKRWVVRHHPDWLAPVESTIVLDSVEVMDHPMNRGFLMLAEMSYQGTIWRESSRWVLVHNEWGIGLE